jgi:hypothetical protein
MGQVTLFAKKDDFKKDFENGEIVAQTWAWVGSFDTIFPFWQVRFSEIHDGENKRSYYCSPVPYGVFTGVHWFYAKDIKSTGLKWRVPTYEELDEWCEKHPYDVSTPNRYLRELNSSRRDDERGWYCQLYEAYPEERELVKMLDTLGIDYRTVTRDNFDEKMGGFLRVMKKVIA